MPATAKTGTETEISGPPAILGGAPVVTLDQDVLWTNPWPLLRRCGK